MDKIRFLCSKIYEVEWSGILYYSVTGGITNPSEMIITVEDIYLMDKGSHAFTEYDYTDPKYIKFMMDNPRILSYKIGHIHSHNNFGVFFSGTDMSELDDNSAYHNYYVSLIVNNRNEMVAKVAFRGETSVSGIEYTCKAEDGQPYTIPGDTIIQTKLFVLDCLIERPLETMSIPQSFIERADEVIKLADEKAKALEEAKGKQTLQNNQRFSQPSEGWGFRQNFNNTNYPMGSIGANTGVDDESDLMVDNIVDFTAFILRMGNPPDTPTNEVIDSQDNLEDAIEELKMSKVKAPYVAQTIIENYTNYYETYFEPAGDYSQFYNTLEEVIETLDTEADEAKVLKPLVNALKIYSTTLNQQVTQ